jgi:hypothetical protein
MYGSGFFHMRMKLPSGYTAGVVTTFYVSSSTMRLASFLDLSPPDRSIQSSKHVDQN